MAESNNPQAQLPQNVRSDAEKQKPMTTESEMLVDSKEVIRGLDLRQVYAALIKGCIRIQQEEKHGE